MSEMVRSSAVMTRKTDSLLGINLRRCRIYEVLEVRLGARHVWRPGCPALSDRPWRPFFRCAVAAIFLFCFLLVILLYFPVS